MKLGKRKRAHVPEEVIHADVCGPFEASFSGYRCYVLFKDDYTRCRLYIPESKNLLNVMSRDGHQIQIIVSDNRGEFDNTHSTGLHKY